MEQLSFFRFLVIQTTLMGWGLFFLAAVAIFLLVRGERRPWLFALPLIWLLPLVLSALFYEPEHGMKSADWTGYGALASLLGFVAASAALLVRKGDGRASALGWIGINTPMVFLGALVTGMAAGGTWL